MWLYLGKLEGWYHMTWHPSQLLLQHVHLHLPMHMFLPEHQSERLRQRPGPAGPLDGCPIPSRQTQTS